MIDPFKYYIVVSKRHIWSNISSRKVCDVTKMALPLKPDDITRYLKYKYHWLHSYELEVKVGVMGRDGEGKMACFCMVPAFVEMRRFNSNSFLGTIYRAMETLNLSYYLIICSVALRRFFFYLF